MSFDDGRRRACGSGDKRAAVVEGWLCRKSEAPERARAALRSGVALVDPLTCLREQSERSMCEPRFATRASPSRTAEEEAVEWWRRCPRGLELELFWVKERWPECNGLNEAACWWFSAAKSRPIRGDGRSCASCSEVD